MCYRLATVTDVSGGEMKVRVNDTGATLSGKDFHPLDPQDEQEADLVQMVHDRHAEHPQHAAEAARECAYTNVGQKSIVISVNPYRWIDIYGTDVMREHYEAFGSRELSPHVFAIASDAYRALCVDGGSQAIITSGESGSGKTENTKQIFHFMAEIAGSRSEGAKDGGGVSLGMEGVLINSNPVLEAFGNAKTLRNNNSSRFGKLVTVHFDGWGKITGSHTKVRHLPAAAAAAAIAATATSSTTSSTTTTSSSSLRAICSRRLASRRRPRTRHAARTSAQFLNSVDARRN